VPVYAPPLHINVTHSSQNIILSFLNSIISNETAGYVKMYLHSNVNSCPLFKWIKFPSFSGSGTYGGRGKAGASD
jgi:hypothetical protein